MGLYPDTRPGKNNDDAEASDNSESWIDSGD